MRIDSSHRSWFIATLSILIMLAATFGVYALNADRGLHGGSVPGLVYGVAGYFVMLYAALFGARKRVPAWRIGRAQTWMRGHLWLGFLSLPLILFHCAFTWKGSLTTVLMALLFATVASGILGAALQHFVPIFMARSIPLETIYEEIPNVRRKLSDEADLLADAIAGNAENEGVVQIEMEPEIRERFAGIYIHTIRPVLVSPLSDSLMSRPPNLAPVFDSLRKMLPIELHSVIGDLENVCEEERQLRKQRRIHLWLHGWLFVHVPLSLALLVLGAVHAVVALRYRL
ncbi:MAG TPA: hypothetical protein VK789_34875 [Bryobacteraceae bacterium]|nr:hypothetical protein [Bryobacteraceae bacterium]